MADFIDDTGRLITDLSKVRPEAAAAVEACEEPVRADGSIVRRIKLYNKVTALEKAGKHKMIRAFEDRAPDRGQIVRHFQLIDMPLLIGRAEDAASFSYSLSSLSRVVDLVDGGIAPELELAAIP